MNNKYFSEEEYYNGIKNSSFFDKFKEDYFAQNWYAAFCNNDFKVDEEYFWSVSWRSSGGDVATIRGMHDIHEDYIDWYCSGITGNNTRTSGYVGESFITDEIKNDLKKLGWVIIPYKDDDYI